MTDMTVTELAAHCGFKEIALPDPARKVDGVYIGDLLSWVMGHAEESNALVTIMSNLNVLAVASLLDLSCVILTEGVTPDEEFMNTAKDKGINVFSTKMTTYEACVKLSGILK
jgi:hypothetical protein